MFNTITKLRYDFFEFKKFFIDSKTAAKSNANIDQFEILQRIDNSIKINHNTTKSINFIFEMNTTSSIDSINFNTLIKSIIFHIIIENTFFLLCLIDFNRLKTYFNNVKNQLIQLNRTFSVFRRYDYVFFMTYFYIYFHQWFSDHKFVFYDRNRIASFTSTFWSFFNVTFSNRFRSNQSWRWFTCFSSIDQILRTMSTTWSFFETICFHHQKWRWFQFQFNRWHFLYQ